MLTKLSAPITVQWELTPWCPNACLHCYNYWRTDFDEDLMVSEEEHALHRTAAQELAKNRVMHVTITGGEPLAVIQQFAPYVRTVKESGATLHLNSTLVGFTHKKAALLKDLGISSILVSLMSANEGLHNEIAQNPKAFERTIAGIKLAREHGFRYGINMVVTKKNLHTIRETGLFADGLGAAAFCATKAAAPTNCPDFSPYRLEAKDFHVMLSDLMWLHEEHGIEVDSLEHYPACSFPDDETRTMFGVRNCLAGKTVATIGFDGLIRPCSHAHLTYGNVAQEGLKQGWESMGEWRDGSLVPEVCRTRCVAYAQGSCGGGCRTDAHAECSDITASDPYCLQQSPTTIRKKKPLPEIPVGSTLKLAEGVQSRPEDFGHIVYRSSSKWTAVDAKLFGLLATQDVVTANDVAILYNVPEENATKTLQHLLSRQILELI